MKGDQAAKLRLQQANKPSKNAKTISVVSGKGGVGKSNIALNLAIELRQFRKNVLVIDLDVGMGNIDILLGQHADKSIRDLLNAELSILDIIVEGPHDVSYVSGGTGFSQIFSVDQPKIDHFLRELQKIKEIYDYIIFDIGAGASNDSMCFILASEETIVVTTTEPTSIADAYAMVKKITHRNKDMPIAIIMNRADTTSKGEAMLDQLQAVIHSFLKVETEAIGILPDDPVVTEAVLRQTPFILWKKKAPVTKAFKRIAGRYVGTSHEKERKQTSSFVQKLKQLLVER